MTSLSFLGENKLVAIGGDDKNTFMVWDLATGVVDRVIGFMF